ncbi:MAG: exodeoxyribonuclease III [Alphaproteobacteria bacterium]
MSFKIATWNVNSITVRSELVAEWIDENQPDVVCLQELKCQETKFPYSIFEDKGYNTAVHGQKTYNGVALLSKWPLSDIITGLPTFPDDEQARYVEAVVSLPNEAIRIASIYLPNGNPADGVKYEYKLSWMKALKSHVSSLLSYEEALVLAGDYNVIPTAQDVYAPQAWEGDALYKLETRRVFHGIIHLGLQDAFRACDNEPQRYTFWDYQAGAWQKNNGLRIDHLLLSPEAADRLVSTGIDKHMRGKAKPSDHVPIWAELR